MDSPELALVPFIRVFSSVFALIFHPFKKRVGILLVSVSYPELFFPDPIFQETSDPDPT